MQRLLYSARSTSCEPWRFFRHESIRNQSGTADQNCRSQLPCIPRYLRRPVSDSGVPESHFELNRARMQTLVLCAFREDDRDKGNNLAVSVHQSRRLLRLVVTCFKRSYVEALCITMSEIGGMSAATQTSRPIPWARWLALRGHFWLLARRPQSARPAPRESRCRVPRS